MNHHQIEFPRQTTIKMFEMVARRGTRKVAIPTSSDVTLQTQTSVDVFGSSSDASFQMSAVVFGVLRVTAYLLPRPLDTICQSSDL